MRLSSPSRRGSSACSRSCRRRGRSWSASTAGTVVGLEDRIALVDAQLSYAAARDLAPPYREALWGERVELMNALVYVRFAQTQGC